MTEPIDIENELYTLRANLIAAMRILSECLEEVGDHEDRELLADAGKLVDDALSKIKRFGNAGRWTE